MLLTHCTKQALLCVDHAGSTALDIVLHTPQAEPIADAWRDAVGPELWQECVDATNHAAHRVA